MPFSFQVDFSDLQRKRYEYNLFRVFSEEVHRSSPLRLAVVCMSNMNRSMEAHSVLRKKGFCVRSFGTGCRVKLPGSAPNLPVVYDFSRTYKQMYNDLLRKDRKCYRRNGLLRILERNERIKPQPERFQECSDPFDVIFTCEERVCDSGGRSVCQRAGYIPTCARGQRGRGRHAGGRHPWSFPHL